jgi:hypothetical protein
MPFYGNQLYGIGECVTEAYLLSNSNVQIHTR